jgi:hypothetical protein
MKYFVATLAALIVVVGIGYFSKEGWNTLSEKKAEKVQSQLEIELFPIMLKAQSKEFIFARPMYVLETSDTLRVYCEYMGDKLPEAREKVRTDMQAVIKQWLETQPTKYKFTYVLFTDEDISPVQK